MATPDIDLVLVDIMMPEMDGYETMREIRTMPRYRNLPLVAVTAKAMKGDREKCIGAGATDYVSKPVDIDQLLAVLRVQLSRSTYMSEGDAIPNGGAEAGLAP
jgi:CheY-like chemotaxis protein